MVNKIIKIIIIFSISIILFISIYEMCNSLITSLLQIEKGNLNWGITLKYSLILFIILSFILSVSTVVLKNKKHKLIIMVLVCVLFCIAFISNIKYTPYKFILLITSSLIGFIIPNIITILCGKSRNG